MSDVNRRTTGARTEDMSVSNAARSSSGSMATTGSPRLGPLDWIALILLIVGGLNWGLVGLFDFDLVAAIFGNRSMISRLVYALVGLSALYTLYLSTRLARRTA